MTVDPVKVLLVEDNPADADLLQETLADAGSGRFRLTHVARLGEALELLRKEGFDVILLDLTLPDSEGLDTLVRTVRQTQDVPIVVMTGSDDDELAIAAVKAGAQDYLVKGQVDANLLTRAVRYAVERRRLLAELEQARQQERHEREFHALEALSRSPQTTVTARALGMGPLRESAPKEFEELVAHYRDLMDQALEERTYKTENNLAEKLQAIADRLALLKTGPRDVVEIHSTALKAKTKRIPPQKAQAYVEEGQLMVLRLMGFLASQYRSYALIGANSQFDEVHGHD